MYGYVEYDVWGCNGGTPDNAEEWRIQVILERADPEFLRAEYHLLEDSDNDKEIHATFDCGEFEINVASGGGG